MKFYLDNKLIIRVLYIQNLFRINSAEIRFLLHHHVLQQPDMASEIGREATLVGVTFREHGSFWNVAS